MLGPLQSPGERTRVKVGFISGPQNADLVAAKRDGFVVQRLCDVSKEVGYELESFRLVRNV